MNTDSKKTETKQCIIPVVVCSVLSPDGSYVKFESSCFSGSKLTKANFNLVIDWLKKESEKYPDTFS